MESIVFQNLFLILLTALFGGLIARSLKLPPLIGYLAAGIFGSRLLANHLLGIQGLAEIGLILLLFSVGLELSLSRLAHTGAIAVLGAIIQMFLVGTISFIALSFWGISAQSAIALSCGFSLSSTALVVKLLEDKAELDAIHGEIMVGWLLTQDLAVIPIIALLPLLSAGGGEWLPIAGQSLLVSFLLVASVFFLGRLVVPFFVHTIASANSRELLVLASVCLALGTAYLVSLFGLSPALGAFLAGVVISETQENHAIFSETRPLRNLFVILFFVTLGFFVNLQIILSNIFLILFLVLFVLLLKFIVIYIIMFVLGYRGKVNLSVAIGLSQIGEFSFVIFLASQKLGILSEELTSIGIAATLLTLLATPFLFKSIIPFWRKTRKFTSSRLSQKSLTLPSAAKSEYQNHIIIAGFGRMGRVIGKALEKVNIPYVVIDYNYQVVRQAHLKGLPVIFGDPAEPSILQNAGLANARAVIIAIPDRVTQEEVISFCQTRFPKIPIIARAHLDEDVSTLTQLKVKKVIQPEFEAALSVVREILHSSGKNREEISKNLKTLRRFHSLNY